ncbi:MAG: MBOAT family O-acyltransferase [Ruthenibacterium sp.]
MTLTSVGYLLFFAVVAVCYYLVPKRAQNAVLLLGSLCFYGFGLPKSGALWLRLLPLFILISSTVFTFVMGKIIADSTEKKRRIATASSIFICVLVLAVFKYYNFFVPSVLGFTSFAKLALPLGISFYTFASISYLVDVSRGDMPAATDFVAFAVFVSFFATITSGPICRAQKLLPQLAAPRNFDEKRTVDALRLALFGFFKQIAIANVLGLYVNQIFEHLDKYTGFTLTFAAFLYAIQLYFEFAGYSDIARASALLLGIDIPVNFKTPYFATNFSGFWSRWHISLSTWLQDYIFMPLVWGRWTSHLPLIGKKITNPPMISSVALVFIISGFWHGNTLPFVLWGCLQAVYRVGEELLHKWYKKPQKKPKFLLRAFKTVCVFILWAESLVFFRIGLLPNGTAHMCLQTLAKQLRGVSFSAFLTDTFGAIQSGFYVKPFMVAGYCAFILIVLSIGFYTDWLQCFRQKDKHISLQVATLKPLARWGVYYGLTLLIFAAFIMQSGGFGTVSFAYANF